MWTDEYQEGAFAQNKIPRFTESNINIHVGLFEDTIPGFAAQLNEDIGFIHVDCDIYSATRLAFDHLKHLITSGTVIVFNELWNYWGWLDHEYKAFMELVSERGFDYEYIAYQPNWKTVSVLIR